ncbi:serine/arginine repetitive matrix protein 1 isoform X4 [Jatropha curcas]|uniref:serine/arginine repetitive matrix protein 1 isoform X4 n=1 Tax=Jatropha curcas TaxID=180498 RepID=UPI0005FB7390|nr:serine/arginine repetitive matrix protein 1 isoform X4 [Jatropha curcas]
MSGGFFRGTSADQDTRFSNKQAKLLKSQKFAPELEHLVDMRKVKMDVIRPWIANRVTELLGFEDEVLINFIYGLLDAKEVNGKEVQISLTGFMEKNTGKFMKELWTLLLSAQKNESGVPQQFLDAKEEETRKKQAEMDRITNEIQKKKEREGKELDRERLKKMDGGAETKANVAAVDPTSKYMQKGSTGDPKDEKETENRNGVRGRSRSSQSPQSADRSYSPPSDRRKSRSLSSSPEARRRSISSDRVYRSPEKRSVSPHWRYSSRNSLSPSRRRSLYLRQRSPSPVRHRLHSPYRRRSPSPVRRRSPSLVRRRRSRSPVRRRRSRSPLRRRRSPSPLRHRRSPSPIRRRRSPSPLRRRRSPSPMRRRSPSPVRRRSPSPVQRRSPSPVRRRSPPVRRRSPSLLRQRYQRSPSTPRRRSISPRHRSPIPPRRRSPVPPRRRSPSPYGSSCPSPVQHRSPSPVRRSSKERRRSPVQSPGERFSMRDKSSPVPRRPPNSLRSPQGDAKDRKDLRYRPLSLSPSPERSPSPSLERTRYSSQDRRLTSPYESAVRQLRVRRNRSSSQSASPVRQKRAQITCDESLSPTQKPREQKPHQGSPESSKEDGDADNVRDYKSRYSQKQSMHSSIKSKQKDSPVKVHSKDEHSPEREVGRLVTESRSRLDIRETRKKDQEIKSEKGSRKGDYLVTPEEERHKDIQMSYAGEVQKSDQKKHSRTNDIKDSSRRHKSETTQMLVEKADHSNGGGAFDSGSDDSDKHTSKQKRKHKRSHREEVASDDDYSYDSDIEEKKEAKRRRKEEKKLRKEEKRRRREERRRRKEERRAENLRLKDLSDVNSSDDEQRKDSHPSDNEDSHSEQKKLEIELRRKALESLKAKKGINH